AARSCRAARKPVAPMTIDDDDNDITVDADEPESIAPSMRSVGRVIAVGGGRGGVGKSLVAVNLAVYFAQLGKSVVLVDADAAGSNLHAHFGLRASSHDPALDDGTSVPLKDSLVSTSVPGLDLLPGP